MKGRREPVQRIVITEYSPAPEDADAPVRTKSPEADSDPTRDIAHALKLAAAAGQWEIVAMLARQLEAMRRDAEGGALRVVDGGRA